MDASDAVALARVATCSRALHDLFSDGVSKASIEHCREASNRANMSEAHVTELSRNLHEVTQQRDTAMQERDAAVHSRRGMNTMLTELEVAWRAMRDRVEELEGGAPSTFVGLQDRIRTLEWELAEAKRARTR